jgi:hypothetical protein
VTVYVPPADTVIEGEVAPLLHNSDPVKFEAVNNELPQLSVTVIIGVGTNEFMGEAAALPALLVQPLTV